MPGAAYRRRRKATKLWSAYVLRQLAFTQPNAPRWNPRPLRKDSATREGEKFSTALLAAGPYRVERDGVGTIRKDSLVLFRTLRTVWVRSSAPRRQLSSDS